MTGPESSDHSLHPSSTSCRGLETLGRPLLPLGLFSYLPNGGLGWVISEGSEDLQSIVSGTRWRGAGLVASLESQTPEIIKPSPSHSSNQRGN